MGVRWLLLVTLVASACSVEPEPSARWTGPPATVQPSADHAPTLADLRDQLTADGSACSEIEHTNPDVPAGITLACEKAVDVGTLRIESVFPPGDEFQRVHATFLPVDPGGSLAMSSQVEALRTPTGIPYPGADPEQAVTRLANDLTSPGCRGEDCITPIGTGTFSFQTGVGGAWVLSLEVTRAE